MLALVFSHYDKLLNVGGTLLSNLIPANSFLIFIWVGIQHINTVCLGLSCVYLSQFKVCVFTSDNADSDVISGKWQNTEFPEDFAEDTFLLAAGITYSQYHKHTPMCRLLQ